MTEPPLGICHDRGVTPWTEVHGVWSPSQHERLERALRDADDVNETAVRQPYSSSAMFDERWFVVGDGSTWRLVAADPPVRGVSNVW